MILKKKIKFKKNSSLSNNNVITPYIYLSNIRENNLIKNSIFLENLFLNRAVFYMLSKHNLTIKILDHKNDNKIYKTYDELIFINNINYVDNINYNYNNINIRKKIYDNTEELFSNYFLKNLNMFNYFNLFKFYTLNHLNFKEYKNNNNNFLYQNNIENKNKLFFIENKPLNLNFIDIIYNNNCFSNYYKSYKKDLYYVHLIRPISCNIIKYKMDFFFRYLKYKKLKKKKIKKKKNYFYIIAFLMKKFISVYNGKNKKEIIELSKTNLIINNYFNKLNFKKFEKNLIYLKNKILKLVFKKEINYVSNTHKFNVFFRKIYFLLNILIKHKKNLNLNWNTEIVFINQLITNDLNKILLNSFVNFGLLRFLSFLNINFFQSIESFKLFYLKYNLKLNYKNFLIKFLIKFEKEDKVVWYLKYYNILNIKQPYLLFQILLKILLKNFYKKILFLFKNILLIYYLFNFLINFYFLNLNFFNFLFFKKIKNSINYHYNYYYKLNNNWIFFLKEKYLIIKIDFFFLKLTSFFLKNFKKNDVNFKKFKKIKKKKLKLFNILYKILNSFNFFFLIFLNFFYFNFIFLFYYQIKLIKLINLIKILFKYLKLIFYLKTILNLMIVLIEFLIKLIKFFFFFLFIFFYLFLFLFSNIINVLRYIYNIKNEFYFSKNKIVLFFFLWFFTILYDFFLKFKFFKFEKFKLKLINLFINVIFIIIKITFINKFINFNLNFSNLKNLNFKKKSYKIVKNHKKKNMWFYDFIFYFVYKIKNKIIKNFLIKNFDLFNYIKLFYNSTIYLNSIFKVKDFFWAFLFYTYFKFGEPGWWLNYNYLNSVITKKKLFLLSVDIFSKFNYDWFELNLFINNFKNFFIKRTFLGYDFFFIKNDFFLNFLSSDFNFFWNVLVFRFKVSPKKLFITLKNKFNLNNYSFVERILFLEDLFSEFFISKNFFFDKFIFFDSLKKIKNEIISDEIIYRSTLIKKLSFNVFLYFSNFLNYFLIIIQLLLIFFILIFFFFRFFFFLGFFFLKNLIFFLKNLIFFFIILFLLHLFYYYSIFIILL